MKILKRVLVMLIILVALLLIVVNFSEKPSAYKCEGILSPEINNSSQTLFLKITEFRWWVYLWRDENRDAHVWIEIPNIHSDFFHEVEKVGNSFQIFKLDQFRGSFSSLSQTFSIRFSRSFFQGNCVQLQR
tara:strand:+ start:91 stop:483 length:393 start_codon:yes stop_codon:yes gene_type:complete